jgi:hypothetical protein
VWWSTPRDHHCCTSAALLSSKPWTSLLLKVFEHILRTYVATKSPIPGAQQHTNSHLRVRHETSWIRRATLAEELCASYYLSSVDHPNQTDKP